MGKQAGDNNQTFGALVKDPSKASDDLPHMLLIAKLNAYGFGQTNKSYSSCELPVKFLLKFLKLQC